MDSKEYNDISPIDLSRPNILEDATDKVLYPETDITKVFLMGKEVKLRPLPISFSKRISRILNPIRDLYVKAGEGKELPEDFDIKCMDALLDSIEIMSNFYQLGWTKEVIEANCSVQELLDFADKQLEVNRKNDFLLLPLRVIIHTIKAAGGINLEKVLSQGLSI